jgi:Tat protein secretion system quality control protein TatD with DNase activity
VPHVAAKLAELHGVTVELIAEQTTKNFSCLFKAL